MKLYLTVLMTLAVLIRGPAALAQDENPAEQHLKPLETLIGTWEREVERDQFVGRMRVTYDWVLRGRFIREVRQFQPQGETEYGEPFAVGIFGWDENDQTLTVTSFMGFGSGFQTIRHVSKDGDGWKTGKFVAGVGTRPGSTTRTTSWTIEEKDTLVVTTTGRTDRDGNPRPDRTVRYTRVK